MTNASLFTDITHLINFLNSVKLKNLGLAVMMKQL